MPIFTDHLTKLTCAARTAKDLGYVHTGRAFERLISLERERLKLTVQNGATVVANSTLYRARSDT